MNPAEEAAFEASIYHYFLFKAHQASTAAAREASQGENYAPATTDDASTSAANDNQATTPSSDKEGDVSQRPTDTEANENNVSEEGTGIGDDGQGVITKPPPATGATGQLPSVAPPPPVQPPTFGTVPMAPDQYSPIDQFPGTMVPPGQQPSPFQPPMCHLSPPNMMMMPGTMPAYVPGAPPAALQPAVGQFPGNMVSPPFMAPVQSPVPPQPSVQLPLAVPTRISSSALAEKYKKLADVFRQEFPQLASRTPENSVPIPPDACMRYTLFPKIQHEVNFLRYQRQLERNKESSQRGRPRKRTLSPVMPPVGTPIPVLGPTKKKARTESFKYARIATRKDVPEDVKELIATVKKESYTERRAMKQKIARLEAKVESTKEELEKKQAAAQPSPRPRPLVPMPPPKPRAPPRPLGPPATFESRYRELQDFKVANNHTRVPGKIPGLGRWVAELRRNYRQVKENPDLIIPDDSTPNLMASELTKERMDLLDEIGFEWDVAKLTLPWQTRFEQLLEFKAKTGHCNVPRHYKENPSLGEWVHRQREAYAKGEKVIQGERMDKLNAVGFMWRTGTRGVKVTWEERLEQCRDFRRVHGHLNVPPPADPIKKKKAEERGETLPEEEGLMEEERSFRWWAFRQRDYHRQYQAGKKSPLDKKRIKQLNELGFDWESRGYAGSSGGGKGGGKRDEETYRQRIEQLTRVKDLYGDCNDVKNIERVYSEDERKRILSWMKNQRKAYKAWKAGTYTSLSTERRQMLENLEFNFEPRKHYAPYGSKKGRDDVELEDEDDDSTMRDYRYIQGASVSM